MKQKISFGIIIAFLLLICAVSSRAQEEEVKDQLFLIWTVDVSPATSNAFEEAIKAEFKMLDEHNFPFEYHCYVGNDFKYHFLVPINNYADIDNYHKAEKVWQEAVGETAYSELIGKFKGNFISVHGTVERFRADLSFNPENKRLAPEEMKMFGLGFYYVKPFMGKEFEALLKDWIDMVTELGFTNGFDTFVSELGTERPYYLISTAGKGRADFFSEVEKETEIRGERAMEIWNKAKKTLDSHNFRMVWHRKDLSYVIEKEE